jgi:arginyl-tRNA synthetase
MMLKQIRDRVAEAFAGAFPEVPRPTEFSLHFAADPAFGDLATNVAMISAKPLGLAPRAVAEKIVEKLQLADGLQAAVVAGPGFINMKMTDEWLAELAMTPPGTGLDQYRGKVVVTEFSDPNPFKVLHVGHLYTSVVGDAITRLVKLAGGEVHPVNFGGDVGRHVAQAMWAILGELGGENPEGLDKVAKSERSTWMAKCYVKGSQAYEADETAQLEIKALNARIYQLHGQDDHDSRFAQIYWKCRSWSYDSFDAFYARLGIHFDRYYPESETAPIGVEVVKRELEAGVYQLSHEAVVFEGEKYGLHTRVFITSQGLPTYETKDVGVLMAKWRDYHFDRSIVITGNDILEYMRVVLKSVEQFEPELATRSLHITHGNVKLAGGVKMSSRKGNFLSANDVIDAASEANAELNNQTNDDVTLSAVKYAFLRTRIGADLVYSPEESVSLEGNSGPYLQYAHARARSILSKAGHVPQVPQAGQLTEAERLLVRKMAEYSGILAESVDTLMPHVVCTYLYELAQGFNRFYEGNRVMGDPREALRLVLVRTYADILRHGLSTLGIAAPERL